MRSDHRRPHTCDNRQSGADPRDVGPSERKQSHSTRLPVPGEQELGHTGILGLGVVRFGARCKERAASWGLSPSGDGCPPQLHTGTHPRVVGTKHC